MYIGKVVEHGPNDGVEIESEFPRFIMPSKPLPRPHEDYDPDEKIETTEYYWNSGKWLPIQKLS